MFVRKLGGRAAMAAAAKSEASAADLWHGDEAEAHLSQLAVLENFATHGMYVKFTDEEAAALEGRALSIALAASKDVGRHGTAAATLRVTAPAAVASRRGGGGFGAPLPVALPAEPLGKDGAEAVLRALRPSGAVVDLPSSSSSSSRPGSAVARKLLGGILGGSKKGASVSAEAGEGSIEGGSSTNAVTKPFDEAEVAAAVAAKRAEIEAELARKLAADEAAAIRRREKEEAAELKRVAAEKAAEERRVAAEAAAARKREEARLRAEAQGAKQKEAFEAAERKRQELEAKKEQAAKAKAEADEAKRVAAAEAAKAKEEAARLAAIAKAEADKELAARKLEEEKAAAVRKAEQEKELAAKKKAAAEAAALKKAAADKAAAERKAAAEKAAAERKEAAEKAAAERKAAAEEAAKIKAAAAEKAAKQRALAERADAERRALDEAARKADAEAEAARDAATLKAVLADTRALRADLEMEALRAGKRASVSRRGADEAAAAAAGLRAMPSAARDAAVSEHAARLASRAALVVQQALADVKGLEEYVGLAVNASAEISSNKKDKASKLAAAAGAETIDARGAVVLVDAVVREALQRANAEGGFSFELPPPKPLSRGHSPAVLVQRFRRSVPAPPPLPPRPKLELPEEQQPTPRAGVAAAFARRLGLTSQSEKVEVAEMMTTTPRGRAAAAAAKTTTPRGAAPAAAPASPAAPMGKHAGAAGFFLRGGSDIHGSSSAGSFRSANAGGGACAVPNDIVTPSDSGSATPVAEGSSSANPSRSASKDGDGDEGEAFRTPRGGAAANDSSAATTPRGKKAPLAAAAAATTPRKELASSSAAAAAPATPDAVPTPPAGSGAREGVPAQADALAAAATTAAAEARAAAEEPTTRVRRARRSRRSAAPASDEDDESAATAASSALLAPGLKKNAAVSDLFSELCAVMPDGVMEAEHAPPSAADSSPWVRGNRGGRDAAASSTTEGLELGEQAFIGGGDDDDGHDWAGDAQAVAADAARHAKVLRKAAAEVTAFSAVPGSSSSGMTPATAVAALASAVADVRGRLQVLCVPPSAVFAHLAAEQPGAWPQAKWDAMTASADLHAELRELDKRQRRWVMQRGRAADEGRRVETFLDGVRARIAALEKKYFVPVVSAAADSPSSSSSSSAPPASVAEGTWLPLGVPSDPAALAKAKAASLHVASLLMSRVLFEVANLERAAGCAHARCLAHVADAARVAHKAHQLAGGLDAQSCELFDKVRSLARYYMRVLDPALVKSRALLLEG